MKIGFKVNGQWASQYFPVGAQLHVSVIVDNMPLARSLADMGKMVIHRFETLNGTKDEGYGGWHKSIGEEQYATMLATAHGDANKDIWVYVLNEPNCGSIEEQREMLAFVEAVGRRLVERGFKVVVINSPPANWRGDWIDAGTADSLLSWASQNRNSVIIGYHEYTEFHLIQFGAGERNYSRFNDPNYVSKSNWATSINPDNSWHIGHVTRLIRRARNLGLNPRFGCTEINYGEVQDPPNMDAKVSLASQFPPSPQMWSQDGITLHNGQHTLRGYWQAMFPQWSWEQTVIEHLKWYANIMGVWGVEFMTLYAFGYGGSHGQDYWNDLEFHNQLIQWQSAIIQPPQPASAFIYPRDVYNVNIRKSPVNGAIIGYVPANGFITVNYIALENGWHKFTWNGTTTYTSAQYSKVIYPTTPDIKTVNLSYDYDNNDAVQRATHNQIQSLVDSLE